MIDINFSRPSGTSPVKGYPSVGMSTDSDEPYSCETEYSGVYAYGYANEPQQAKRQAVSRLLKKLENGE